MKKINNCLQIKLMLNKQMLDTNIYSNGFKVVNNNAEINTSGATYIYMAFAEKFICYVNRIQQLRGNNYAIIKTF